MKCSNCGSDSLDRSGEAYICAYCRSVFQRGEVERAAPEPGRMVVHEVREIRYVHDTDRLGFLLGCACWFVFPLAWIIWAVSARTHPKRARVALVIALVQTALFGTAMLTSMLGGDTGGVVGRSLLGPLRIGLPELPEIPE